MSECKYVKKINGVWEYGTCIKVANNETRHVPAGNAASYEQACDQMSMAQAGLPRLRVQPPFRELGGFM